MRIEVSFQIDDEDLAEGMIELTNAVHGWPQYDIGRARAKLPAGQAQFSVAFSGGTRVRGRR